MRAKESKAEMEAEFTPEKMQLSKWHLRIIPQVGGGGGG